MNQFEKGVDITLQHTCLAIPFISCSKKEVIFLATEWAGTPPLPFLWGSGSTLDLFEVYVCEVIEYVAFTHGLVCPSWLG